MCLNIYILIYVYTLYFIQMKCSKVTEYSKSKLPIWMLIMSIIAGLMISTCCICCLCIICKRKKRSKEKKKREIVHLIDVKEK